MEITRQQNKILKEVKKYTNLDYDLSKHTCWDIIEDLIYEIEELNDTINAKNERIKELENQPLEEPFLPEEEYGY